MRNFIVALMIFILLSSIMFLILRPVHVYEQKNKSNEKSHVEELLTGSIQSKNINQDIDENNNANEKIEFANITNNETFQQKSEELQELHTPKLHENIKTNDNKKYSSNFEDIAKELSEKYDNNPNAEVSTEDMENFMLKILEFR